MTPQDWRAVGTIDPRKLGDARHQAHNAVQWLARIARSYVEPADNDNHMALDWLDGDNALVTREIAPGLVLELRLPELVLQFKEEGERVTHQLALEERSPAKVEAWLLVELLHRDVDRERLSKDLPYTIAGLMTGDAVDHSHQANEDALKELSNWYANAAFAIGRICEENASLEPGPSPVRCWPHHFDIASLIALEKGTSETARSIAVGLSPGDGHYGEPYFYVTPWPYPDSTKLPDLPDGGHWHTKDFVGAVLPASVIIERGMTGEDVVAFLRAAVSAGRECLGA